jgi:glucosylceramidase
VRFTLFLARSIHTPLLCSALLAGLPLAAQTIGVVQTTGDGTTDLLTPQPSLTFSSTQTSSQYTIAVTDGTTRQTWDGVGAAMSASSAYVLSNLGSQEATIIGDLFSPSSGIGLNLIRVPMGATDFTPPSPGEYNYRQTSGTSFALQSPDTNWIIPQVQAAQAVNAAVQIVLSPWSPPGWMKSLPPPVSNDPLQMYGGQSTFAVVDDVNGEALASYFLSAVQSYQNNYVGVYAVTPQNEPEFNPSYYPSNKVLAGDEYNLVNSYLGSSLSPTGVNIWGYDHNYVDYAFADTVAASSYVAGSAFHCYSQSGETPNPANMTTAHNNSNKPVWMTECTRNTSTSFSSNLQQDEEQSVIGAINNYARGVIYWNAVLNSSNGPVIDSSACTNCWGVVQLNSNNNPVFSPEYYALGHIGKYVVPGAQVITTSQQGNGGVLDVGFRNPDGTIVVVAYNDWSGGSNTVTLSWNGKYANYTIPSGALVTFKWQGTNNVGPVLANTNYQIENVGSAKCIDATNSGVTNGTVVQQYTCGSNQPNQGWQFVATTAGNYRIVNRNSMKNAQVIDAINRGNTSGTKLQTYLWSQGTNQQWVPTRNASNQYTFKNVNASSLCLAAPNIANNTQLDIETCNGSSSQLWTLSAQTN